MAEEIEPHRAGGKPAIKTDCQPAVYATVAVGYLTGAVDEVDRNAHGT